MSSPTIPHCLRGLFESLSVRGLLRRNGPYSRTSRAFASEHAARPLVDFHKDSTDFTRIDEAWYCLPSVFLLDAAIAGFEPRIVAFAPFRPRTRVFSQANPASSELKR
jgi:hypothetical protein